MASCGGTSRKIRSQLVWRESPVRCMRTAQSDNAMPAATVHREAHGLVADEIYEVEQGT